jgi:hypothetical protein
MHAYEIILWLVALVLGLFGWWIIFLNFSVAFRWFAWGKRGGSTVPMFGGLVAMLGMFACPLTRVQKLAWVPLAVDFAYFLLNYAHAFVCVVRRSLVKKK